MILKYSVLLEPFSRVFWLTARLNAVSYSPSPVEFDIASQLFFLFLYSLIYFYVFGFKKLYEKVAWLGAPPSCLNENGRSRHEPPQNERALKSSSIQTPCWEFQNTNYTLSHIEYLWPLWPRALAIRIYN